MNFAIIFFYTLSPDLLGVFQNLWHRQAKAKTNKNMINNGIKCFLCGKMGSEENLKHDNVREQFLYDFAHIIWFNKD